MSLPLPGLFAARQGLVSKANVVAWLIGAMALLKLVAVLVYVPATASIFDLGFSFDPFVRSLYEGKGFVSCVDQNCDHASRMPALPYFLYALSPLTTSLRVAALIKALLLSALVYLACRRLPEKLIARTPLHFALYGVVALFIVFAPNFIKHASMARYEEGYNLELLAIAAVGLLTLVITAPKDAHWGRYAVPIIAAATSYLFKSSMILVCVAVSAVVVYVAYTAGRKRLALALIALALAAPLSWLGHNYATGGRLSVMSSYDGENMFRGWNARTLDVFPQCSLDILFQPIGFCNGKPIDLPNEVGRAGFDSEWAWNDGYKKRAMDWIIQNPGAALKTFGVKLFAVLVSPRQSPYRLTDGTKEISRSAFEEILVTAWLSVGRVLEFLGLAASLILLVRGDARARRVAAASLLLTASYVTPYLLGYGYERHFSIFVMLTAVCDLFLLSEAIRLAGKGSAIAATQEA